MHGKRKYNNENIINGQPIVQHDNEDAYKTKDNVMIAETVELINETLETINNNDTSIETTKFDDSNQDADGNVTQVSSSRSSKGDFGESDENTYDNNGNITSRKKKCINESKTNHKTKIKREPLPMKLRALPQSFWQQPNQTANQSPGTVCPALPLLCKEDCLSTDSRTSAHEEDINPKCHKEMVTDANTDLLFSLFRVVEEEQRNAQGQSKVTIVRRGRPKKPPRGALKDDDPCLVSTVTEALLPLLPARCRTRVQLRIARGDQALAAVALHERPPETATVASNHNYSHLLSEVVFRL